MMHNLADANTLETPLLVWILGVVVAVIQIANLLTKYLGVSNTDENRRTRIAIVLDILMIALLIAGVEEAIRTEIRSNTTIGLIVATFLCAIASFLIWPGPLTKIDVFTIPLFSVWIIILFLTHEMQYVTEDIKEFSEMTDHIDKKTDELAGKMESMKHYLAGWQNLVVNLKAKWSL